MQKVSLYIRNHSTRRYEKVKPKTTYPMGTNFVLRYGGKWETLTGEVRMGGQGLRTTVSRGSVTTSAKSCADSSTRFISWISKHSTRRFHDFRACDLTTRFLFSGRCTS